MCYTVSVLKNIRLVRCETGTCIVVKLARQNSDLVIVHIACSAIWHHAANHSTWNNTAISTVRTGHVAVCDHSSHQGLTSASWGQGYQSCAPWVWEWQNLKTEQVSLCQWVKTSAKVNIVSAGMPARYWCLPQWRMPTMTQPSIRELLGLTIMDIND